MAGFFNFKIINNMKKHLIFLMTALFVCGAIFLFANPAQVEALTSVTVEPVTNNVDNLVGQANTTWRFTINNITALTAYTDAVEITFPSLGQTANMWDFSNLTASTTALGGDALQFATKHSVNVAQW